MGNESGKRAPEHELRMDVTEATLLMAILAVSTVGPGLLVLPWLRVAKDEKLVVVVGVSWLAVFLMGFTTYLVGLPVGFHWAATAACVACIAMRRSTLADLIAHPLARSQVAGFCLIVAHGLLLQASIRSYSGLGWVLDWHEHFERTLFFIERPDPVATRFLAGPFHVGYTLTARPPVMNVLTAHAIVHGKPTFAAFQVASTWLNSLACLPAIALSGRLARVLRISPEQGSLAAAAAITLLPAFAENVTFPWTKLLAAFYVLAAVLLITRRHAVESTPRLAMAGALLGAGVGVHYSSAVFSVVLGVAAVTAAGCCTPSAAAPRWTDGLARAFRAALAFGLAQLAVLLPWLLFAIATFGARGTFATNTAVTDAAGMNFGENLLKIALNCRDTLVPHFLRERPPLIADLMTQPNPVAVFRDWWFAPLQVNFPMAVGTVGQFVAMGVAVVWLTSATRPLRAVKNSLFWPWFFIAGFLLGVGVHGARDTVGLAHICLQPLILVASVVSATVLPTLPLPLRLVAVGGLAWDYLVGIALQFWLERLPLKASYLRQPDGAIVFSGHIFGIDGGLFNAAVKQFYGMAFLGDCWPDATGLFWGGAMVTGVAAWACLSGFAMGLPMPTRLRWIRRDADMTRSG